jgi:hypothetical protein
VLQFNQSPWLAKYISLNTEMRKKAKNDFEKDFYKLMNNAVFGMYYTYYKFTIINLLFFIPAGKTMENVRKRIKMELVSADIRLQKLINKPTFKHATSYNENLSAVSMENKIIQFNKPMYVGFAVLEISKTLMYNYHYMTMKEHYKEDITLMYTDTGILFFYYK